MMATDLGLGPGCGPGWVSVLSRVVITIPLEQSLPLLVEIPAGGEELTVTLWT